MTSIRPSPCPSIPNSTSRACPLEALNVDCLIAILSSTNTLADLSAFIRASPAALASFFATKASILLSVLTNELGPAVRDALVLSCTEDLDSLAAGSIEQTFEIAIACFRECLLRDSSPWVSTQDVHTASAMARLARTALSFADLYIRQQRHIFTHFLTPPGGTWSASLTERRRIAQAFLRFRVITGLYNPAFHDAGMDGYFTTHLAHLFKGWELEQISALADFVDDLIESYARLDKNPPPLPRDRYRYYGDYYHALYFYNLPAFHGRLCEAQREDGLFLGKLVAARGRGAGLRSCRLTMGPVEAWRRGTATSRLGGDAVVETEFFEGDRESVGPPWAWVYTWNGGMVKRWGEELVPRCRAGCYLEEHHRVAVLGERWRFLGMVFWDRDRVEELLKAEELEGCRGGWLWSRLDQGL
ncbi:hypothetical protein C8A05DRAFT_32118 [Staphylotrichum tortipilum]|uniref:Uncharacterized protein n=1 Tax=Staphylotrichum tortipilum TaxID=2831512 RepID=A0AAN6MPN7_9PEZI|nr:hypothetical protein C8A05DRAFT_32118 [Staphylotrichum longicolle]